VGRFTIHLPGIDGYSQGHARVKQIIYMNINIVYTMRAVEYRAGLPLLKMLNEEKFKQSFTKFPLPTIPARRRTLIINVIITISMTYESTPVTLQRCVDFSR